MGSRANDAFSNLMSNVPGVDTSGFMKRSMNDMKTKTSPTVSDQMPQSRRSPGIQPRVQVSVETAVSPETGRGRNQTLGGIPEAADPVSPSLGTAAPAVVGFTSADLDVLGVGKRKETETIGGAGRPLGDLFEGIPGAEVVDLPVDTAPPSVPERRASGDLLGIGVESVQAGFADLSVSETPPETSALKPNSDSFFPIEDEGTVFTQKDQGGTESDFGCGFPELGGAANELGQPEDPAFVSTPDDSFAGFGDEPSGREGTLPHRGLTESDSCWNTGDVGMKKKTLLDASGNVVSPGTSDWGAEDTNAGSGVHPPPMPSAKTAVWKTGGKTRESMFGPGGNGSQGEHPESSTSSRPSSGKKNKFSKYRDNLQKKAMEYGRKGFGAVMQGFEAASDWVDKQLEERKRVGTIHMGNGDIDAEVVEMAAELEFMAPPDRAMVLNEIDPTTRQRIIDLLHSQGVDVMESGLYEGRAEENPPQEQSNAFPEHAYRDAGAVHRHTGMSRPLSDSSLFEHHHNHMEPMHDTGVSEPGMHREAMVHSSSSSNIQPDSADFLGIDSEDPPQASGPPTPPIPEQDTHHTVANPDDLDDFFAYSGKDQPGEAQQSGPSGVIPDLFEGSGDAPTPPAGGDLLGFGQEPSASAAFDFGDLSDDGLDMEDVPEHRKKLIQQRVQRKRARMQAALQEKLNKEQEELDRRENQHALKDEFGPMVQEWKEHHRGNIRGLLTTLDSVLWEGAKWKTMTVGDLLDDAQVKKAYMKANLVVHPDKVRQQNGTDEQVVRADMIFDTLKEAWAKFK